MPKRLISEDCDFDFNTMMNYIGTLHMRGKIGMVIYDELQKMVYKRFRECLSGSI